jgi:hypothetical protein
MTGWLIALSYAGGTFGTWLAGAARIGADFDRFDALAHQRSDRSSYHSYGGVLAAQLFPRGFVAFLAGLLWPFAVPVYLAFNKGKTLGLKKNQMRALLDEAEAEIARIKKSEGWNS